MLRYNQREGNGTVKERRFKMRDWYEMSVEEQDFAMEQFNTVGYDDEDEDESFWAMVADENWKRFEGCFD